MQSPAYSLGVGEKAILSPLLGERDPIETLRVLLGAARPVADLGGGDMKKSSGLLCLLIGRAYEWCLADSGTWRISACWVQGRGLTCSLQCRHEFFGVLRCHTGSFWGLEASFVY
jgi:hypothetical protein